MALYHSGGNPSVPGDLLEFRPEIASPISSCVIGEISFLFICVPIVGRSSDSKKSTIVCLSALSGWEYNVLKYDSNAFCMPSRLLVILFVTGSLILCIVFSACCFFQPPHSKILMC